MAAMDEDGSGEVDFDEFFHWCVRSRLQDFTHSALQG